MSLTTIRLPGHREASDPFTHKGSGGYRRAVAHLEVRLALEGCPHPEVEARRLWAAMAREAAL